jgi:hypothetical protein
MVKKIKLYLLHFGDNYVKIPYICPKYVHENQQTKIPFQIRREIYFLEAGGIMRT